jgi:epoxyqueuosine reductase
MKRAPHPVPTPEDAAELARTLALEAGFDVARIADATAPWDAGERLMAFLGEGHHGTMAWMETTAPRRCHPTAMWPEALGAVMLGLNYAPPGDPLAVLAEGTRGAISVYAQGDDYHDVVKKRLKAFAGALHRRLGAEVKVFVDTAPLMEKPLAARAGLGWQGKHTNLVSRTHGSWLFLGCVLVAAKLEADTPEQDHCGSCRACLDVCPTAAFPAPYRLDARRCISYLTIEHAGPIDPQLRPLMGNRIYGCDDCLAVCPWNKFAEAAREVRLQARPELDGPDLAGLARLDDAGFRALFARNPVKRIGVARFLRNVAIAIGNSGDPSLAASLEPLLSHPDPVTRGAAVWALGRLAGDAGRARAKAVLSLETDTGVRAEWQALLGGPDEAAMGLGQPAVRTGTLTPSLPVDPA